METSYHAVDGFEYLGIGGGFCLVRARGGRIECVRRFVDSKLYPILPSDGVFGRADRMFDRCRELASNGDLERLATVFDFDRPPPCDLNVEFHEAMDRGDVSGVRASVNKMELAALGRYFDEIERLQPATRSRF